MKGENNPFYGHQHTEETKRKMSEAKIGTHVSEHVKDAVSRTHKGKIVSNEIKNKISLTTTGKMCITNGVENLYILKTDDIPQGYYKGLTRGLKK